MFGLPDLGKFWHVKQCQKHLLVTLAQVPRAHYDAPPDPRGEVPEWSNGAVSKTVVGASLPRVRIPEQASSHSHSKFVASLHEILFREMRANGHKLKKLSRSVRSSVWKSEVLTITQRTPFHYFMTSPAIIQQHPILWKQLPLLSDC